MSCGKQGRDDDRGHGAERRRHDHHDHHASPNIPPSRTAMPPPSVT
jgi:hypothetical protein